MSCRCSRLHTILRYHAGRNTNSFHRYTMAKISPQLSKIEHQINSPFSMEKLLIPINTGITCFHLLQDINGIPGVKIAHAHMIKTGFQSHTFLFNCLLDKYAKCGLVEDARQVFDNMAERDAVSWNSMIAGYLRCGNDAEPLELFCRMQREGICPTQSTFVSLLAAFGDAEVLEYGKQIHADIVKSGFGGDVCVLNALVRAYGKCARIEDACRVFDKMPERDDISWKVMLNGYVQCGHVEVGVELFRQMLRAGMRVSSFGFSSLLSACGCLEFEKQGRQFHAYVFKVGMDNDVSAGNGLISMYAKYKSIEDAHRVFEELCRRDVVSWNTLIAGYAQNGHADVGLKVFWEMQLAGVKPNQSTIASFVSSCGGMKCLKKGREVLAQIMKIVENLDVSAENAILSMFVRCGSIDDAYVVFEKMSERNLISWNAMIAGFAQYGYGQEALQLFNEMQWEGLKVNHITVSSALSACSSLEAVEQGKQLHSNIMKTGLETNISVGNALLVMYGKCGNIEDAWRLFTRMPDRDVVAWNMMIAGYVQNGYCKAGLDLFRKMQQIGIIFNRFTLANVLGACLSPQDLAKGKQVHALVIKVGFEFDVALMNALVTTYNKCGSVGDACELFKEMTIQDAISWSTMIAGLSQYEYTEEALDFSCQMHRAGMKMNHMTFASVLRACANLASLEEGKQFHAQIIRNGIEADTSVGNAVVTMYAKCACIDDACSLFENMVKQDVVSWNAMIAGLAQHGKGKEALELFEKMQLAGIKPDHITYIGVLSACSHVGLVEKGRQYFDSMERDQGIVPREEHYSCMVDLLARAGRLVDAELFINNMPFEPGSLVWRTLLSACRVHGNVELGIHAAEFLFKLEPQDTASYVLLSNIYASVGRWDDREIVRKIMKERRVSKEPGCSWIQVKSKMHAFLVGDKTLEKRSRYVQN